MKKSLVFLIMMFLSLTIACKKNPSAISIDCQTIMHVGDVQNAQVTITPKNSKDVDLVFTSSNPDVATFVDYEITALAVGTTTVKVEIEKPYLSCVVTITVVRDELSLKDEVNDIFETYDNAISLSTRILINDGENESDNYLAYEINEAKTAFTKLKSTNNSFDNNELYILGDECYVNLYGEKSKYTLANYEKNEMYSKFLFNKYVTSNFPFIKENAFYEGLSLIENSEDESILEYELDIVNYSGTALNLVGVSSAKLIVKLDGENIVSIKYQTESFDIVKFVQVEFLGLQCEFTIPSGY